MNNEEPIVGGLYTSRGEDGLLHLLKVLVADAHAVHVRFYAERFSELPPGLTSEQLSLGSLGSPGGFGIGHAPMSREGFLREQREFVARETVSDSELEGYRIWAGEE